MFFIGVFELLQALKIYVYQLTLNNHSELSGLKVKYRTFWEGEQK